MSGINTMKEFAELSRVYEYLVSKVAAREIPVRIMLSSEYGEYAHPRDRGVNALIVVFNLWGVKEKYFNKVLVAEMRRFFKIEHVTILESGQPSSIGILVSLHFIQKLFAKRSITEVSKACGPVIWRALVTDIPLDQLENLLGVK